jgi:hypothetical protein
VDVAKTTNGPTNIFGAMNQSRSRSGSADIDDNKDREGPLPKTSDHSTAELSHRSLSDSLDGDNSYDRGAREVSKARQ